MSSDLREEVSFYPFPDSLRRAEEEFLRSTPTPTGSGQEVSPHVSEQLVEVCVYRETVIRGYTPANDDKWVFES